MDLLPVLTRHTAILPKTSDGGAAGTAWSHPRYRPREYARAACRRCPELARLHTDLDDDDVAWLQLLQADWQIIADLSFADLVLWLPDRGGTGFWAGGQMRPTTGPTAYVDDILGSFAPTGRRPLVDQAFTEGRLIREGDPEWRDDVPVRNETIPVRRSGRVIAVVGRHTNLLGVRTPSRLELSYLQTAADLTQMIALGHFPEAGPRSDHADSPRVGDGFLRVDEQGRVVYASPNALSAFRRLGLSGDLTGVVLADLSRDLVPSRQRPDEETLSAVLGGRAHRDTELGTPLVSLIVRSIPLRPHGEHGSVRSSWSATSRTCVAATVSWSRRTPPSGRSTTG